MKRGTCPGTETHTWQRGCLSTEVSTCSPRGWLVLEGNTQGFSALSAEDSVAQREDSQTWKEPGFLNYMEPEIPSELLCEGEAELVLSV